MAPPSRNPSERDADPTVESKNTPAESSPEIETSASEPVLDETHLTGRTARDDDLDSVPKEFGRYRIEKELGRGGMGAVFLAHDGHLDRKVAIKIPFFRSDR